MATTPITSLWERLPNETAQAYAAWRAYLEMEAPRSLRRLAQDLHRSVTLLNGWSSRWRWQRRLEAYLADQEERRLHELERDIRTATDRHIEIARLLQERALERLKSIDITRLSPESLAKFLALGVDVERKALGIDKPSTGSVVT